MDSERDRIEQSNDVSGIIVEAAEDWVPLDVRFAIADALYAAGYRKVA